MTKTAHRTALLRRTEVQRRAAEMGFNTESIRLVITVFYSKVRQHQVLGPLFHASVGDWGEHLTKMEWFWRGVLLNSGEYSGKPVQIHAGLPTLEPDHFPIWLALFSQTLSEVSPNPDFTAHMMRRAENIAVSFIRGLGGTGNGAASTEVTS
ncbi:group III truncated hemoglobin [Parasedimentitalea maritima]|uniref:Globin n=1 Tax=Parasedimentitalea maritima TaxID=2578117 RepID=A0A6A4RJH8_9RHOB|nr:group III truncated hemoglobin [Zongyanglinia marina]KAE9630352.1 globin [Zongyanglinia marina]